MAAIHREVIINDLLSGLITSILMEDDLRTDSHPAVGFVSVVTDGRARHSSSVQNGFPPLSCALLI